MKLVYRDSIEKEIAKAIKKAKADGKYISAIQLSKSELEELKTVDSSVDFGKTYKGVTISAGG